MAGLVEGLLLDPIKGVLSELLGLCLFFFLLYNILSMLWGFMKKNMKALKFMFDLMETVAGAVFNEISDSDFDNILQ